jgi:hypothetical protein
MPHTDKEIIQLIKRYRGDIGGRGLPISFLGRIPIISVAPSPVVGVASLWINSAHYAANTLLDNGIQIVFPDGTNKNLSIPFSLIPS